MWSFSWHHALKLKPDFEWVPTLSVPHFALWRTATCVFVGEVDLPLPLFHSVSAAVGKSQPVILA